METQLPLKVSRILQFLLLPLPLLGYCKCYKLTFRCTLVSCVKNRNHEKDEYIL
jgi:hypothetical protein